MVQAPLRMLQAFRKEGEFTLEGLLECTDSVCGATYPVVEGVPVVLKDVGSWWRQAKAAMSSIRSTAPGICGYFDTLEGDGPSGIDGKTQLGTYTDFHYGEFVDPHPAPNPASGASNHSYWESVVTITRPEAGERYPRTIDLGCSVGRFTFEMARFSDLAVGLDLDFGKVSAAARTQRGRRVAYERRERGRLFRSVEGPYDAPQNVLFLVSDALAPPFLAESFDLVGALNLLDNVVVPLVLLGQMDALLRGGGILILGTPYEWKTEIADPAEWLETEDLDAPALLRRIFEGRTLGHTGFRYSIERDIEDVRWGLRGHSRRWTYFVSHVMRTRKEGGPDAPSGTSR